MKIALTYAPSEQQFLPVPPLGISALSQHLINNRIRNDVIDLELEMWIRLGNQSSEYAFKPLKELVIDKLPVDVLMDLLIDYEVISFSVMGKRQIPYIQAIVQMLKNRKSKLQYVILGGVFFDENNAKEILMDNSDFVDFIIIGEGWEPMLTLLRTLLGKKEDYRIPGVAFLNSNKKFVFSESRIWQGELPIPNYKKINKKGYIDQQTFLYGIQDDNIVYHVLVGDRKCPFNCSFCRISKNTKKIKPPKEIANEMIELNKISGASCFSLVCNEMNPSREYFEEFVETLLLKREKVTWFTYLRPDKLTKELLVKAREAGCVLIRYGVETGSQKILDNMDKQLDIDEINQIMKYTYEAGIWNHINIITGYLYEDKSDIDLTLDFLEKNKKYINSVRVNPFYIPVNSPIHLNPEKYGVKLRKNTGSYVQFDEIGCKWEEKQKKIEKSTAEVLLKCIDSDINFAGILPFLVAKVVDYFGDIQKAEQWIKKEHNYLCKPISPDTAKWNLAHPDKRHIVINAWEKMAGKRGENYQTIVRINSDGEDSY